MADAPAAARSPILPPLADRRASLVAVWQLYANLSGIGNDVLPAAEPRALGHLGQPRRPLGQHAADAARDAARLRALARRRASRSPCSSTPRRHLAARAHAGARRDADAADRRDRAADGALVRLRPHAQGAARRARDVLPDHRRVRRGLRRQRARGRGAAALDGREPRARLPLGALPDVAAVLLRRACASRSPTPSSRRSSPSTRARARASASTCRTPRTRSAPISCWPPCSSAPCSRSRCSRSPTLVERIAIPWYRLSRQGGRRA